MDYKIYHNPRCSKSRQALQILEEKNVNIQVIEYLKEVPSKEELIDLIDKLGIQPHELIRKGELIFKENYKGKTLTQEEWVNAMVDHPKLIERPIVVHGNHAIIGRPPEKVLELI